MTRTSKKSDPQTSPPTVAMDSPAKRDDDAADTKSSFSKLPFVYRANCTGENDSNWHVPSTEDYETACQRGHEYAAHYAQYLKEHPFSFGANTLGYIVKDIDFTDESGAKAYWVGFFSYLERLIHAQVQNMDVFADVDQINTCLTRLKAR